MSALITHFSFNWKNVISFYVLYEIPNNQTSGLGQEIPAIPTKKLYSRRVLFTDPLEDQVVLEVCSLSTALLIFPLIVWSQPVALWHVAMSKHSSLDFMGAFQAYSIQVTRYTIKALLT